MSSLAKKDVYQSPEAATVWGQTALTTSGKTPPTYTAVPQSSVSSLGVTGVDVGHLAALAEAYDSG